MNNFWFEKIKEYKNYRYLLTKFDFKNLNECSKHDKNHFKFENNVVNRILNIMEQSSLDPTIKGLTNLSIMFLL